MKPQPEADIWVNPVIEPMFHQGIEAIFSDTDKQEPGLLNREGLIEFCGRLNALFSQSNLSRQEADFVYRQLFDSGLLINEPTGMPDPEEVITKETFENFISRIAIKKNDDLSYSLFFVKTGCGFTYFYGHFVLPEKGQMLNLKALEVWRASMPC